MTNYSDDGFDKLTSHWDDEKKRKRYRPQWGDAEAVVSLFNGEVLAGFLLDFPDFEEEISPFEEAVKKAEKGDPADLVRLAREGPPKKKPGRPRMSNEERAWRYPVHIAAFLVPQIQMYLQDFYPERPDNQIRDRALMVASAGTGASVEAIANYLSRSRKNRQRLI
jgi:hypothetical protein